MKKLVIIGSGGHGKVVADIAVKNGYDKIVFLDDSPNAAECAGYPVVGAFREAEKYADYDFIVAIGNSAVREKLQNSLVSDGRNVISLIHPNAVIAPEVPIGIGSVIVAGVVINPAAKVGKGCIINTGSTVDHDDVISDFVHISVGCHVAGTVSIGKSTWLGAGAVVSNNLSICGDCMIGAGAVVVKDIDEPGTYVGVPAKRI